MIEIIIIFLLLLLNGLFAMCEIALVSSKRIRLEQAAKSGSKGALIALKLLAEPEKFLSTVQVGITLVGIIAGAYGAETFTKDLQPYLEKMDFIKPIAEEVTFGLIVAIITYFSLIIGELVPKTIALNNPEKITIRLAPFMRILSLITYPFVIFLSLSTKLLLKLLFIKENKNPPVTEEELKYMIDTGSQHGIIEKEEGDIMHSVIKFADRKARDVMTAKNLISWLDINESKERILDHVSQSTSTKYPVVDLVKYFSHSNIDLREYLSEPAFFPENMSSFRILEDFKKKKIHIGFVVNEHGETKGLITLHDLVEDIIGDLPEGEDETQILNRPDGSLLVDGAVKIEEIQNALGLANMSNGNTKTLSEFVAYQLQGTPKTGSHIKFGNYRFEIVDMDGAIIDKVLISKK
jgi:putative hemolysin